jgi:hypothetical protein
MEDSIPNRMATPRKRGRPSLAEIAARMEPVAAQPVTIEQPNLPPMAGFFCPKCGRAQCPRITKTHGLTRYCACGLCGKPMRVEYSVDHKARVIHPM